MKSGRRLILRATRILPIGGADACNSDDPTSPASEVLPADVLALGASLDAFSSLSLAKQAGYSAAITDCMSNGDEGAMGVHFGDTNFIDGKADALHTEVLIYEPGTNGEMSVVGGEFLVPFAVLPGTSAAPQLFGQKCQQNDVFGVWALHV